MVAGDAGAAGGGADAGVAQGGSDGGGVAQGASDGGLSMIPQPAPTLLEAGATVIEDVSPDENSVLVSHQPVNTQPDGLTLVTVGAPPRTLIARSGSWGWFSPDGRSIVFGAQYGQPGELNLAHSDGSGSRQLTTRSSYPSFAGRWFYYDDESGAGVSLYRVLAPDGEPELIASFQPPQGLSFLPSPDGESVAWCHYLANFTSECYLRAAGSATPVKIADGLLGTPRWAPDGSFLVGACEIISLDGSSRRWCDSAKAGSSSVSNDFRYAVVALDNGSWPPTQADLEIRLHDFATGATTVVPTPGPFDGGVFRPSFYVGLTGDGSRLIAELGASLFTASTSDLRWTEVSATGANNSRFSTLAVSPDSRKVAIYGDQGLVESVDGNAPRVVGPPGRSLQYGQRLRFEPAGGLDKAFFFDAYANAWLANGDGSGDWLVASGVGDCDWVGRKALCLRAPAMANPPLPNEVVVVTDTGKAFSTQVEAEAYWRLAARLTAHKLFYVAPGGGLYVSDAPAP